MDVKGVLGRFDTKTLYLCHCQRVVGFGAFRLNLKTCRGAKTKMPRNALKDSRTK